MVNDECECWYAGNVAAANDEAPIDQESRQIGNTLKNEKCGIAREIISAIKELVTTEL